MSGVKSKQKVKINTLQIVCTWPDNTNNNLPKCNGIDWYIYKLESFCKNWMSYKLI